MAQFNEKVLLENFERLLRHEEEMGTKALTKLYDMTNYMTDFNNLSIIKELDAEITKILFTAKVTEIDAQIGLIRDTISLTLTQKNEEEIKKPVTQAVSQRITELQKEYEDLIAKSTLLNEIKQKSITKQYDLSIFNGIDTTITRPDIRLIQEIKDNINSSNDIYMIDKYIITFIKVLKIVPFQMYKGCTVLTIKELLKSLLRLGQHSYITTNRDKITTSIDKSAIVPAELDTYIKDSQQYKELNDELIVTPIRHFIWQKTLDFLKPLFDTFRTSGETIRGGNIISLEEMKNNIREKIKKIKPKKSVD